MEELWFEKWFNSPYYHLLYGNRNEAEAADFVESLTHKLDFRSDTPILDLACGKGRYAIQLNKLGYQVEGIDLSPNSIAAATAHANDRLHFAVHDMRQVYKPAYFAFVLNLFTSFGYFESDAENQQAMNAFAQTLRPDGTLLIDFMNTPKVLKNLVREETKTVGNTTFQIQRRAENGFIIKDIRFTDENGQAQFFQEKVKIILSSDFERYFAAAGLQLKEMLGGYDLAAYNAQSSERMIFIAQKI